mgnify:CR=1 FL=1
MRGHGGVRGDGGCTGSGRCGGTRGDARRGVAGGDGDPRGCRAGGDRQGALLTLAEAAAALRLQHEDAVAIPGELHRAHPALRRRLHQQLLRVLRGGRAHGDTVRAHGDTVRAHGDTVRDRRDTQ